MRTQRAGVVAVAGGAARIRAPHGAAAQDNSTWPRFPGSAYASQSDPTDTRFHQGVGGDPAQGLPHAEPGQPRRHEGCHQALQRDRGRRRLAAASRRSSCRSGMNASRGRPAAPAPAAVGRPAGGSGGSTELRLLRRQGGEALSGLQRPGAHGHRRQAHHRGAQRAGGRAPQAAARPTSRGSTELRASRPRNT